MEFLNYHHLLYFAAVAREGSVRRAAAALHRTQPTVSSQLALLEASLGERLFERQGRRLALTDVGRVVLRYAEEIHLLGRELLDTLRGRPTGRLPRVAVGVVDVLPKLLAHRLLGPALEEAGPVQVECHEDSPQRLLNRLVNRELDVILSDAPVGASSVKAYSHLLGESGTTVFASGRLRRRFRSAFPRCLDGQPFLMPFETSALRRPMEQWLESQGVRVSVTGIFEDSALMKIFGQAGAGAFVSPTAIERDVVRRYGVAVLGRIPALKERFFAITVDRRVHHPVVAAITRQAQSYLASPGH